MNKKRYAIVRVDEDCPKEIYSKIDNKFVCNIKRDEYGIGTCYCRYGDTKEQLINKITTAIEIAITMYEKGLFLNDKNKNKSLAKFIVEFLGVEE